MRGQNGVGRSNTMRTVCASMRSGFMSLNAPRVVDAVAGSVANWQLKTKSSALNGVPSCHVTPRLSFHTTDRPSAATPPFSRLGISAARIGSRTPSPSQRASAS